MSKQSPALLILVALVSVLVIAACSDVPPPATPTYNTGLSADETRNSAFAKQFPLQFQTYARNNATDLGTMTEYGGAVNFNKENNIDPLREGYKHAQPYLKNLWLGYPFSYEYRAARGHTWGIRDILHIDRINRYGDGKAGLPATCWNCKTPKIPGWVKEYGDDKFWSLDFNKFRTEKSINMDDETIGCANCHDPKTMKLVITSIPLKEALIREGRDPENIPRNEMRSLVCAQCHVEYYFTDPGQGVNKKPVFPWTKGKDPAQIYEYYNAHGDTTIKGFEGKFMDWVHPVSKTPMLKAQHPEYETFFNGPHGAAGVSCADCHMSHTRLDGKKKISNHQWRSPLKDIDAACRQCHADKTPEYLRQRVEDTQKKTFDQLLLAQETSVRAHEAIRLANEYKGEKNPNYEDLIIQAKENVRKGQFFWDMISAENSVGFHNPTKALDTLLRSQEASNKAIALAMQATNYGIGKNLEGDIQTLVPPIRQHSRKLQQSAEHLASHKWLGYLPKLPEAPQVWEENKWVGDGPEPKF